MSFLVPSARTTSQWWVFGSEHWNHFTVVGFWFRALEPRDFFGSDTRSIPTAPSTGTTLQYYFTIEKYGKEKSMVQVHKVTFMYMLDIRSTTISHNYILLLYLTISYIYYKI